MPRKPAQKPKSIILLKKSLYYSILVVLSGLFISGYVVLKRLFVTQASASSASAFNMSTADNYSLAVYTIEDFSKPLADISSVKFFVFDFTNKKVLRYSVPVDKTLAIPGNYAPEPVSKLYALGVGTSENDLTKGITLMTTTLRNFFKFPVDAYIIVAKEHEKDVDAVFSGELPTLSAAKAYMQQLNVTIKTNLTLQDTYQLSKFIKMLPADKLSRLEVTPSYFKDPQPLYQNLKDITFASETATEGKSIIVLNGSGSPDLARRVSEIIDHLGGRVLEVANSSKAYEKSMLIVDDKASVTVKNLQRIYQFSTLVTKDQISDITENAIDRADIVVILGVDIAKTF